MQIPDAAVGPIIAAVIAALVVFISTVLSKEQKTSEFRQAWIDELRNDVAQYVSGTVEFAALYSLRKKRSSDEVGLLEDNFDAIRELQSIEYRIIFRLNPVKHSDLIAKIKALRRQMISLNAQGVAGNGVEEAITAAITTDCNYILKAEWERVKKGEAGFRFVKWAAMAIAALGLFALLLLIFMGKGPSSDIPRKAKSDELVERSAYTGPAPISSTNGSQTLNVTLNAPFVAGAVEQQPKSKVKKLPTPDSQVPIRPEPANCDAVVPRCAAGSQ